MTFECSMHMSVQTLACTQKSYLQNVKLTLFLKEKFVQVTEDKTSCKKERGKEERMCFQASCNLEIYYILCHQTATASIYISEKRTEKEVGI